jgi:signal peptidase II
MQTVVVSIIALAASLAGTSLARMMQEPVPIIGRFFRLTLGENPGIAFGLRLPEIAQEALIGTALVLVCIVARSAKDTIQRLGFGLIIGGALGNLIDRIPDGLVTDYVAVGTFPVFNVADACITVGAGLLLLDAFLARKTH